MSKKKKSLYRQCKMVRDAIIDDTYPLEFGGLHKGVRHANVEQTSWIPEKFAVVGMILRLKNDKDEWVDGWVVQSVSEVSRTEQEAVEAAHSSGKMRETTDI